MSDAGVTALAEDASTIFYNAAGMTLLDGTQALVSAGVIFRNSEFTNNGTVGLLGNPVPGPASTNQQPAVVPGLFATSPVGDGRLHIGLGLFSPFGLENKYLEDWVGRYQVQTVSLKTIDIDPALAYRINEFLSVGAGIDFQYAELVRTNAIDFGSLCFATIGPGACPALGLLPQGADGRLLASVSNWGVGANFGILIQPTDDTHIGFNYRSPVQHDLGGIAHFNVPPQATPLTIGGLLFQDTSASSTLTFPDVIALGLSQRIDHRWTALLDVDWTLWSHVKQFALTFGNPAQPALNAPQNWHDSVRVAAGGIYRASDETQLRAGIAFDQSPVPDAFRIADLPDSNSIMISTGIRQHIVGGLWATLSYSYIHWMPASLNVSMPTTGTLVGTVHQHSSALGLDARVEF